MASVQANMRSFYEHVREVFDGLDMMIEKGAEQEICNFIHHHFYDVTTKF